MSNNISFPEDNMQSWISKVGEKKPVKIKKVDVVNRKITGKDMSDLISKCDDLLKGVQELYDSKSHKELYDTIVDLHQVKRSLTSVPINKN